MSELLNELKNASTFVTSLFVDISAKTLARELFFKFHHFAVLDLRNSRIRYRTETSAFSILEVFAVLNYPRRSEIYSVRAKFGRTRHVNTVRTQRCSMLRSEFDYVQHRGTVCSKTQFGCRGKFKHVDITAPSPETLRLVESPRDALLAFSPLRDSPEETRKR